MSRTRKHALMGFALGALQGAQQAWQTQRAQEAERLREERQAALRAQQRGEDRAFQQQVFERNAAREDQRFDRQLEVTQAQQAEAVQRQIDAERRAEERAIAGETRAEARQRRLMEAQASMRAPGSAGFVEVETADGRIMTVPRDDPRLLQGMPDARFRGSQQPLAPPVAPTGQSPALPRAPAQVGGGVQFRFNVKTGKLEPATT